MGAGKLAVASDQAHSGARSLRVDGGGGYCDHIFIAHTAALTDLGDQAYGRFYLRLSDPIGQGHVTFLTMKDTNDSGKDLRMGGQSQILMYNRESDDATLPALSPAGIALSVAPAAGQWTCIEFLIDQAQGHITTWVDDLEVPGLRIDAEPTPDIDQQWANKPDWKPQLADIKFGWESYAGQFYRLPAIPPATPPAPSAPTHPSTILIRWSPTRPDNRLYARHTQFLHTLGIPVPRLHLNAPRHHLLLIEDLGPETLQTPSG